MRLWMMLLCLAMSGCFHTIETEPSVPPRPPNPFDAGFRPDVSRRPDVGPAPFDGGEAFLDSALPDSALPDSAMPDASACPACEFDSDCPQPPPFGCGQGICVAGVCTVGTGSCDEGEGCDQDELVCTPEFIELRVRLVTDYEPFMEFDRVVLKVDERVVYQGTDLAGDPVEGLEFGPAFVGDRGELWLELTLFQGCDEIDSGRSLVRTDGSPFTMTFAVARDFQP